MRHPDPEMYCDFPPFAFFLDPCGQPWLLPACDSQESSHRRKLAIVHAWVKDRPAPAARAESASARRPPADGGGLIGVRGGNSDPDEATLHSRLLPAALTLLVGALRKPSQGSLGPLDQGAAAAQGDRARSSDTCILLKNPSPQGVTRATGRWSPPRRPTDALKIGACDPKVG